MFRKRRATLESASALTAGEAGWRGRRRFAVGGPRAIGGLLTSVFSENVQNFG
jgi:hypothetical protein